VIGFPTFVVVDVDAHTTLDERTRYAAAQQLQVTRDFGPRWGRNATFRVGTPDALAKPGEIECRLLQQPTQSGAIGYHSCKPDGTPIVNVFVGLARVLGMRWETVGSHEVLETLADPLLRRATEIDGAFWDTEVCDRVEREQYLVEDGFGGTVPLSNFNYPEAFEPPADLTGVKFDHLGTSTKPNEVRPGGYAQKFDPSKGWVQVGEMSTYRSILAENGLSRGARRAARYDLRPWWTRFAAKIFGSRRLAA
jgi:hypothetical protein